MRKSAVVLCQSQGINLTPAQERKRELAIKERRASSEERFKFMLLSLLTLTVSTPIFAPFAAKIGKQIASLIFS